MKTQLTLLTFYLFVLSLLISYFLIPLLQRVAIKYNIIDKPNHRKIHTEHTPLLGGIAIWGAFTFTVISHYIIVTLFKSSIEEKLHTFPYLTFYANNVTHLTKEILTFIVCGFLIMLIGLIDDISRISIAKRIIFEAIIAFIIVAMGFQPELYFLPRSIVWVITIIWIIGVINAINLLDGANGLASGVAIIAASLLSVVMFKGNQPLLGILLIILVASTLGFFKYNYPKATIFMGSAGSMFIGYVLSVVTILATFMVSEVSSHFALLIPIAILGIPIYDTFSVIIIRILQKKSVVHADQNHLVHRLMTNGHKEGTAVLYIFLFALCSGISAIFLLNASMLKCIIIFIIIVAIYTSLFLFEKHVIKK